jgi:hypothetical protein
MVVETMGIKGGRSLRRREATIDDHARKARGLVSSHGDEVIGADMVRDKLL